jgi:hypothetical protein
MSIREDRKNRIRYLDDVCNDKNMIISKEPPLNNKACNDKGGKAKTHKRL